MSFERASRIADAVLLEGYALYPYRASSAKNQYRWTFGVVAPRPWSETHGDEPWQRRVDCLLLGERPVIRGRLRFLQVQARRVEAAQSGSFEPVEALTLGSETYSSWEEGVTREIDFTLAAGDEALELGWRVGGGEEQELLAGESGEVAGRLIRTRRELEGQIRVCLSSSGTLRRLTLHVENLTPSDPTESRAAIMCSSCVSAHLLLAVDGGEFVSMTDPPELAVQAAQDCHSYGLFPVLVGEPGRRDLLLCAPIILHDHPEIAPESPGDLFDATEIDEILTLRTLTLTPEEKREARALDSRTAALLDRVEALTPDELARLHGAFREDERARFQPGDRVRLRPGARRTDAQDLLYFGRVATVETVLTDLDGQTVLALSVDDDPAAELHRWYGRFQYYYLDEVEALEPDTENGGA